MNGRVIGAEFSTPNRQASRDFTPPSNPSTSPPTQPTQPAQPNRPVSELLAGKWEAVIPPTYQPNRRKVQKLRLEFATDGTCTTTEIGSDSQTLASARGTWRVERSEANDLWFHLDLKIGLTGEAMSISNPVLATFAGDHEWETRGLLQQATCTFRRLP